MKKRKLNVLVACESSGVVRDAFRALGHNAWSCDLLPCDSDSRYHVQDDVINLLRGDLVQVPQGRDYREKRIAFDHSFWDLMIGHPPCTYLCNSGVRWLWTTWADGMRSTDTVRWRQMEAGIAFFNALLYANIPHIAIENPIMHKYARNNIWGKNPCGRMYDQIIQPWQFGHGETKATCLWLKNLPKLVPTDIVAGREHRIHKMTPGPLRWKQRSKTFEGIAKAMAEQWSKHILESK